MGSLCLNMFSKIIFALAIVSTAHCARILAIVSCPSYSHQVTFRPLWKALSQRGHQITLVTTNPMNDPTLTNITEIDIGHIYEYLENSGYYQGVVHNDGNPFKAWRFLYQFKYMGELTLMHPEMQNLIHNQDLEFDLVMLEIFNLPTLGFVERFKVPFIAVSTIEIPFWMHECLGNPFHPIVYPDAYLPMGEDKDLFGRIKALLTSALWLTYEDYSPADQMIHSLFGKNYPRAQELACRVDMMLVDVHPLFTVNRPMVPAVVTLGDGWNFEGPKPLPKDIKSFLDSATEGAIYFSLGTNVRSKELPSSLKTIITDTFGELPYKVLWKYEREMEEGVPENIKISKWFPQGDILRHPNIKLFITQGGVVSMKEALFNHVPMIGMPFFIDQHGNVKKLVRRGLGLEVDPNRMDKEIFKSAILEVINNTKYKENAIRLARLTKDNPMGGLEKAIWWTEYVIRNNGSQHLRGPTVPLYQFFLLDTLAVLFALFFLSCLGMFTIYKHLPSKYYILSNRRQEEKKFQ